MATEDHITILQQCTQNIFFKADMLLELVFKLKGGEVRRDLVTTACICHHKVDGSYKDLKPTLFHIHIYSS